MTNEELFTDLKQFIEAKFSQQMDQLATKEDLDELRSEVKSDIAVLRADLKALDTKVDTIQEAIAETITQVADAAHVAVHEHEQQYDHGSLQRRAA